MRAGSRPASSQVVCPDVELAAVYSSDSSRALDTAGAFTSDRGLDITVRLELREKSYGVWEGKTGPEIEASHPDEFAIWQNVRDPSFKVPGGESDLDVRGARPASGRRPALKLR